jgi:polysaccharide biosynthesis transport protein
LKLVRQYTKSTAILTSGGLESPVEDSGAALQEAPSGLSATQILVILRFYWKITLLIGVSITAVAAFGIKLLPKTFTATATLIIDSTRKDPLAAVGVPENEMPSYIATQMELILSPIVLLPAVDRLKLTTDPQFLAGYRGDDEAGRREYAARNLAGALQVDIGRGGQLLYITASAKYPWRAAELANGVTDVYLEEERRRANEPAAERARRYSEEVTELRAKVATAQNNLAAFRQQRGITELGNNNENADNETQALSTLEQHLLEAQNQRRSLEARSAGQQLSADEALASPAIQQLKTQLSTQQTQLVQLTTTHGPQHPKVLELKSQLALTKRQLDDELHTISDNVTNDLVRARDLETRYARAAADQRAKVLHLRALQGEGAKLELELESAQSVYKRALDGFDQIAFASASNNANVSLLSRAPPPFKASKPNKNKLLMGACVVALLLALGVPLGYELLFARKLRCRDDIERAFALPVLAEFDRIAIVPGET